MSGFKDIRQILRTKCKIEKPLSELALWFTFTQNILSVHDMENHGSAIPIAFKKSGDRLDDESVWTIWLEFGSRGELLVKDSIKENPSRPDIHLNEEYLLTDFVPS